MTDIIIKAFQDLPVWTGIGIEIGLLTHELVGWIGGLYMPTESGSPGKLV